MPNTTTSVILGSKVLGKPFHRFVLLLVTGFRLRLLFHCRFAVQAYFEQMHKKAWLGNSSEVVYLRLEAFVENYNLQCNNEDFGAVQMYSVSACWS